jgi:hypothetical protein
MNATCPECGAALPESGDCADAVPALLEIEMRANVGGELGLRAHFLWAERTNEALEVADPVESPTLGGGNGGR